MVRIKHRYLLINILYPGNPTLSTKETVPDVVQFRAPTPTHFNEGILGRMVREGVTELFGDYGIGMITGSLKVMYLSTATSTAIIRVARDHYRLVWAALAFATRLPKPVDIPCVIQVVRVSGTIRKAEEEAIRRAKDSVVRAKQALEKDGSVGINLLKEHGLAGRGGLSTNNRSLVVGDGNHDMSESESDDGD